MKRVEIKAGGSIGRSTPAASGFSLASLQDDPVRLLHELQVHQVELAEQNEALQEARTSLEASTQRYFELFETAPVGLVTIDRLGVVHEANHLGRRLLGDRAAQPLTGACIFDRISMPSRLELLRALGGPLAELAGSFVELSVATGTEPGRLLRAWFRTHPTGEEGVLLALTDVTDERRAQADLARTRDVLDLSNRVARIGYWETDHATGASHWSTVARELLELQPGQTFSFADLLAMALSEQAREALRAAHESASDCGASFDVQLQIQGRSGLKRWVRITGKAEPDGGPLRRQFGTLQDIDLQVQAEATRLAHLASELASRSKNEFLARMSHDLRTPLNAVLGFSELLQLNDAAMAIPGVAAHVGLIHSAGTVLLEMINDVLDLTCIEAGKLSITLEALDVDRVLNECLSLVEPLAANRKVRLHPSFQTAGLALRGDRVRVRQVLLNLLSNAVKYNRDGGAVWIRVERDGDDVLVAVQDTGLGMSAEKLDQLFQPFNRLGAERLPVEGTGLGLAIARQLAEAMGGRIQVRSTPGMGSEFTLRLPHALPSPAWPADAEHPMPTPSVANEEPSVSGRALSVVYIEDDPVNVELMRAALSFRHQVCLEVATDGPQGLEAIRRLRPDLVLLDLSLPSMDGASILAQMRADRTLSGIPCVAVSAHAMEGDIQQALASGFADYIVKPFALPRLLGLVDRWLR